MQSIQTDTLKVRINQSDTIPKIGTGRDVVSVQTEKSTSGDTTIKIVKRQEIKTLQVSKDTIQANILSANDIKPLTERKEPEQELFNLYSSLQNKDNTIEPRNQSLIAVTTKISNSIHYSGAELRNLEGSFQKFWTFGIGLSLVFTFIFFRMYYQKYITGVVTSVMSMQLAEKLMREKNAIIHRVFLFLNLNFVISLALFAFLLIQRFDIQIGTSGSFITYMNLFLIIVAFLIIRYGLIQLIGTLFDSTQLLKEYLHNTYLINKNLGLYLLPLAISVFYLRQPFADIAFFTAGILIAISLVYKYFRAVQILIKHKVFLFYSILYFCTLEILPVLVGVKYVLSLR